MATNANQRESRIPAPKIPAVIAKPAAPATKSSGAAPKGGGQAASGSKLVQPTVTPKSSGSTKTKSPYDTTGPFNPMGGVGTTPYGPSSTVTTVVDNGKVDDTITGSGGDASLA